LGQAHTVVDRHQAVTCESKTCVCSGPPAGGGRQRAREESMLDVLDDDPGRKRTCQSAGLTYSSFVAATTGGRNDRRHRAGIDLQIDMRRPLAGLQVWPPSRLSSVKMSKKLLTMNPFEICRTVVWPGGRQGGALAQPQVRRRRTAGQIQCSISWVVHRARGHVPQVRHLHRRLGMAETGLNVWPPSVETAKSTRDPKL